MKCTTERVGHAQSGASYPSVQKPLQGVKLLFTNSYGAVQLSCTSFCQIDWSFLENKPLQKSQKADDITYVKNICTWWRERKVTAALFIKNKGEKKK